MMERWELPKGWEWRRLGDICKTTSGGTPKRNVAGYYGGTIPWLKSGELDDGLILRTEETITEKGLNESNAKIFPKGTLLIALYGATVGKLGILGIDAATNQAICAIFPSHNVENTFLFWFLRAIRQKLLKSSFGGAQPNISQEIIRNLEVPIPYPDDPARSLAEQRRIVARLELLLGETRAMREDIQAMRRDLAQVMESVLAEVFPNPNEEMPEGWDVQEVRTISEPPQYGYTQSATTENTGTKFLRITDIQNGNVEWDEVPYCQIDDNNFDKYALFDGDIVFARSGATTGKTFLLKNPPRAVFASYLIRLRIRGIFPDFVYWFFQSSHYWNQVRLRGGAQPNMNANLLSQILVPIPKSLSEQRRIVAYLEHIAEEIRAMDDLLAQDLRDIEVLEQSILAAAFRGEV